jgi:glycosyltransferase involved in cell wall biosynthesis
MTEWPMASVVPVKHPYNSVYLQAKMMHDALACFFNTSPGVVLSRNGTDARLAMVHYGSFDPQAWRWARTPGAVFVFHGITPPAKLLPWNPMVAVRAAAGYAQLRTLPKNLAWIALSGYSAGVLRANGFRRVEESRCIVPAHLSGSEPAAGERHRTLLFVGRISPNKGLLELLDVFERLHDRVRGVRLRIVGTAKAGCRYGKAFADRLRTSGARDSIVWHREPVRLSELQMHYQQALLYLSCSTHEAFGVPVQEAISFGVPAVYRACGGTESVLNGLGLLRGSNPEEIAGELADLIEDAAKRNALLESQRELLPQFSKEAVGLSLRNAVSRLLLLPESAGARLCAS